MSAPSGISSGVGFRNCVLFALNQAGLPAATSTAAYEGVRVSGAKALTINDPEPRRIAYIGDDGVFDTDLLPATEPITGELRIGKLNGIADALVSGQKLFTIKEFQMLGVGTDKRGFEPQVGMLAYRQAKDTDPDSATFGMRVWEFRILPKVQLVSRESGYADTPEEHVYSLTPSKVTQHLWGTAFADTTEGFQQAFMLRGVGYGKPKLVAFQADGTEDTFPFPTDAQALSTAKIAVWKNGTLVSAGITPDTTGVTFTVAPTANDLIVVFYEV